MKAPSSKPEALFDIFNHVRCVPMHIRAAFGEPWEVIGAPDIPEDRMHIEAVCLECTRDYDYHPVCHIHLERYRCVAGNTLAFLWFGYCPRCGRKHFAYNGPMEFIEVVW